jgi:hypothetical protein
VKGVSCRWLKPTVTKERIPGNFSLISNRILQDISIVIAIGFIIGVGFSLAIDFKVFLVKSSVPVSVPPGFSALPSASAWPLISWLLLVQSLESVSVSPSVSALPSASDRPLISRCFW